MSEHPAWITAAAEKVNCDAESRSNTGKELMITEQRLAEMEAQPCALDVLELVEEVRELRSRVWMQATRNVYRTFDTGVVAGFPGVPVDNSASSKGA